MAQAIISKEVVVGAVRTALQECPDPYAQTYLRALPLASEEYGKKGVIIQLLYALNNMGAWRGESAKATKATLRGFCKAQGY